VEPADELLVVPNAPVKTGFIESMMAKSSSSVIMPRLSFVLGTMS